jgi:hypothetical protein
MTQVTSYLGLVPQDHSSGEKQCRGRVLRSGQTVRAREYRTAAVNVALENLVGFHLGQAMGAQRLGGHGELIACGKAVPPPSRGTRNPWHGSAVRMGT